MKKGIIIGAGLLWAAMVCAQDEHLETPPTTLKLNLTEIINPVVRSVNIYSDYPLTRRTAAELGLGWAFTSPTLLEYAQEYHRGLRTRVGLNYFWEMEPRSNSYFGVIYKYHRFETAKYEWVGRQGEQYFQQWKLRYHTRVHAVLGRVGGQVYIGRTSPWFIEPYLGFGLRWVAYFLDENGLPPDLVRPATEAPLTFDRPGKKWSAGPDMIIGLSLGYRLKR